MKITRKQIRKLIKEAITDMQGGDFDSSMEKLSDLYGELSSDLRDLKDYEKIDYILSVIDDDELRAIRVSKNAVKNALMQYPEPIDLYNKVYDDLHAVVKNASSRPDGYRWQEVFTRMVVEALGIKAAWTRRPTAEQQVKRRVNSLMKSKLFVNASAKDKQIAARKISKSLLSLERYGGYQTFFEEMLDDALDGYGSRLQQRLARAAGAELESWGEALSAWGSGDPRYVRWMRAA